MWEDEDALSDNNSGIVGEVSGDRAKVGEPGGEEPRLLVSREKSNLRSSGGVGR